MEALLGAPSGYDPTEAARGYQSQDEEGVATQHSHTYRRRESGDGVGEQNRKQTFSIVDNGDTTPQILLSRPEIPGNRVAAPPETLCGGILDATTCYLRVVIRTAALAYMRDRRLLQTRPAGKDVFYMAGGKIDPGETPFDALRREIREELDVDVADVTELGVFQAPAFGHTPPAQLHMTCFTADLIGEPKAAGEIAEIRYFTVGEYAAMRHVAPGSMLVFERLHELSLIDW